MPIDASEYIRRLKLSAQSEANRAAEERKFRAPTRDSVVYDPHATVKKNIHLDDFRNPAPKHNLFAAKALSADPTRTTG